MNTPPAPDDSDSHAGNGEHAQDPSQRQSEQEAERAANALDNVRTGYDKVPPKTADLQIDQADSDSKWLPE